MQREYVHEVIINDRRFHRVIIDSHYEKRHLGTINDEIILALVDELPEARHVPDTITAAGFEIYVTDPIFRGEKPYRLIWTIHPNENYVGVINAFRRKHGKVSK